ncbi:hypothetical protein GGI04_004627 [Coemansia thaxteri]|nr:hypothetical protein GGI04_004627 [Coemansia thaxteri]
MSHKIPLLRSCERCRRRKQRCDGDQPACGRCQGHGAECRYRESGRFRKQRATTNTTPPPPSCASMMFQVLTPPPSAETAAMLDPVEILKTRELPDLAQGLPESVLQQMWKLVSSTPGDPTKNSAMANTQLEPNLELLRTPPTGGAHYPPCGEGSSNKETMVACAAVDRVSQTHGLGIGGNVLLGLLRASFVDSGMKIRTRQFWATLEADSAGDFAVLAHLAIATREAQLLGPTGISNTALTDTDDEGGRLLVAAEARCFAAARREWDAGCVAASTGAVFALLLLSEYGYQTGRHAILGEFAAAALATARQVPLRGTTRFPWSLSTAAGGCERGCDVEREHVLACFWSAWVRAFTAAQILQQPIDLDRGSLPDFPQHDMCHYTAAPTAVAGGAPGMVAFPARTACCHAPRHAYSAATWQCALRGAEMHNLAMAVRRGAAPAAAYAHALRRWDRRLAAWRAAAWPPEWPQQMAALARKAQRLGHGDIDAEWLADIDAESSHPIAEEEVAGERSPLCRVVGAHVFDASRVSPADAWLAVVFVMYDMTRLSAHRAGRDLIPSGVDPLTRDLGRLRSRAESLDAVRSLQSTLGAVARLGFPPERLGMWVVLVLEQAVAELSERLARSLQQQADSLVAHDALRRLARLVRHLLALKHWTPALVVFTAVVKRFVEPSCVMAPPTEDPQQPPLSIQSPWPPAHVLTRLMRELHIDARTFCAFTMPVVYASAMATSPGMRMRIASLIT